MATRFDRDTAVTRTDDHTHEALLDPGWSVVRGPNGGYLAAIILRAMIDAVDDPARAARSLTIHYTTPPREADTVAVTTRIERQGRSLTTCSARVTQDERLVALALAAFSAPRDGPEFSDVAMPPAPPPSELEVVAPVPESPPIAHRWDTRMVVGRPPRSDAPIADEARTAGWIRAEEPHVLDAPLVAAISDAWIPAVFSKTEGLLVVPTIDLTVHFRSALPRPGSRGDEFAFVEFRTNVVADGFLEEDGCVWAPDGTLLAQSRQLALVMPLA